MSKMHDFEQGDADRIASDDRLRSEFVRLLVEGHPGLSLDSPLTVAPFTLVQYWNDGNAIPSDVSKCLASWEVVEEMGIKRVLFDDSSACAFILENFEQRHVNAFELCGHPAMRSDYFRLCFIAQHGGLYVDADDEYAGGDLLALWKSPDLKVQPLCYQISSDSMLVPFGAASDPSDNRTFYVNNNPIFAPANHPVIVAALEQATRRLLETDGGSRDIQSLTGPGNVTETLVRHAITLRLSGMRDDFRLLQDWDAIALSKWPLEYRDDSRNWRHWVSERRSP